MLMEEIIENWRDKTLRLVEQISVIQVHVTGSW